MGRRLASQHEVAVAELRIEHEEALRKLAAEKDEIWSRKVAGTGTSASGALDSARTEASGGVEAGAASSSDESEGGGAVVQEVDASVTMPGGSVQAAKQELQNLRAEVEQLKEATKSLETSLAEEQSSHERGRVELTDAQLRLQLLERKLKQAEEVRTSAEQRGSKLESEVVDAEREVGVPP